MFDVNIIREINYKYYFYKRYYISKTNKNNYNI